MSRWLSDGASVRAVPAIPRYYQAKARLLDLLGDLPGNTPFPPERELSDVLGMSRTTIRKAMNELVLEGRLIRGTGRQGTTVAPPKQVHRLSLDVLVQDLATREQAAVRITRDVLTVESVLVRGDEPIGVRSTCLCASRFPGFAERYDDTPLRRFLSTTYRVRFGDLRAWCTTTLATPRLARLLGVRPATPVLSVSWLDLVERSWVVLRGDRAHLTMAQVQGSAQFHAS